MRIRHRAKPGLDRARRLGARLARDQRGNTLAIVAAAVFPIVAVIGGGLDLARAHVVKSRLNEACDAAALAGRRAMSDEDIETAKPEATKFFNHNFSQGYLGSAGFTPAITRPDTGIVRVAAATTVPTTLMRIFGYTTLPVSVTCDATQNFDNIDIVLVLDTTGSMQDNLSNQKQASDSSTNAKMRMLRQAVMALYDQLQPAQDQLAAQGLRLRYGIVPYSSTVNVGKLIYAEDPSYIASGTLTYNSRARVSGNWRYKHVNYNITSSYLSGSGSLTTPTGSGGSNVSHSWGGCIEERQTISTITSSTSASSVPDGAHDLDIDLIPNSAATKWRPYLAGAYVEDNVYGNSPVYGRDSSTSTDTSSGLTQEMACPREARRLDTMTRTQMLNYVNSLYSDGYTYHDFGMIWGARFISDEGIFGDDNPSVVNDRPVRRYIIFMTDGQLMTNNEMYMAYGIERNDKRVSGGGSNLEGRHRQRFLIACNEAKRKGVSIWSVVFATGSETTLKACASNDDQYKVTKTGTDLVNTFKEIGKNIGALRLSK